jgi:hypothetical protein
LLGLKATRYQLPLLPPPLKLPPPPEKPLELDPDELELPEDHPEPDDQAPLPELPEPIFFIAFLPQGLLYQAAPLAALYGMISAAFLIVAATSRKAAVFRMALAASGQTAWFSQPR